MKFNNFFLQIFHVTNNSSINDNQEHNVDNNNKIVEETVYYTLSYK